MIVQFALSLIYNYAETEIASVNCMNCLLKPTNYATCDNVDDNTCFSKNKNKCVRSNVNN